MACKLIGTACCAAGGDTGVGEGHREAAEDGAGVDTESSPELAEPSQVLSVQLETTEWGLRGTNSAAAARHGRFTIGEVSVGVELLPASRAAAFFSQLGTNSIESLENDLLCGPRRHAGAVVEDVQEDAMVS